MKRSILLLTLPVLLLCFQIGCGSNTDKKSSDGSTTSETSKSPKEHGHDHGGADALHWPKKDLKHESYMVSLGHHGDHWHGGEEIEPAVAISKDGKDFGEAKITCQLMDGDKAIDSPVEMTFEPKTEKEPAHYAGAKLAFPSEEKKYAVKFEMTLDGKNFSDTVEVLCGH